MDNHDANSRAPQGPDQDRTGRDGAPVSAPAPDSASIPGSSPSTPSGRAGQGARRALRPLLPMRTRPVSPLAGETEPYKGRPLHLVISAFLLTFLLTFIIAVPLVPGQFDIEPGKPAVQSILSPADFTYQSKVLTDKAREQAKNDRANEVWALDTVVIQRQRSVLENALSVVEDVRQNNAPDAADIGRQRLSNLSSIKLTPDQIDMLLVLSDSAYRYWRESAVYPAFDAIMHDRRLTSVTDVQTARDSLPTLFLPSFSPDEKALALAFVSPLITINMALDQDQTQQQRDKAAASVQPVSQTVQKGEAILRQGEIATPEAIEKLREAGLLSRGLSAPLLIGTAGVVSLLMILLHLYIYRYTEQVWRREKQMLLLAMLLVLPVFVARYFLPGHTLLPYMLPLASISMLIAVLLNTNLAVLVTFVLSVLLGMTLGGLQSLDLTLFYIVSGLTGIFTLTRVEKVSAFARAGFYITVSSFMVSFMLLVLQGGVLDWTAVGDLALASILNGFLSTSITYAAFSLLGTLFGITTPLQLMELAHPDQPLLRRLMREAPGTYHHSLVVSNLAEHAAEMIGADPLLTRVCAYYHDIGKVERPYYFIDNQSGRSNVHDELDARESASIIARHVIDGVRLGQANDLPRKVLDAIPQHHGTMLIKFFYYKALEQDPTANPDDFRYPGPKPQTKENAILMLADGVEATVRSMAQSGALDKMATGLHSLANSDASESPNLYNDTASLPDDAIANVVHKTISERIEDGQLDECDLTVRDIARIQEAFVSMLKGIYHPRIAYPEPPAALARGGTGDLPAASVAAEAVAAERVTSANGPNGTRSGNGVGVSTAAAANGAKGHLPKPKTVNLESEHGQQQSPAANL